LETAVNVQYHGEYKKHADFILAKNDNRDLKKYAVNYVQRFRDYTNDKVVQGVYDNGARIRALVGDVILVERSDSATAKGQMVDVTKQIGKIDFPGEASMTFEFDPETKTLYFNGRDSDLKWHKKNDIKEKELHIFCNVLLDEKG